jgi:hypothetical protein
MLLWPSPSQIMAAPIRRTDKPSVNVLMLTLADSLVATAVPKTRPVGVAG